jgi:hypothetical protein
MNKIKICLNFWGQPKNIQNLHNIYLNYLYDSKYDFVFLYTTWKSENITIFKNFFPNSYINLIDLPSENDVNYMDIVNNYNLDETNKCNGRIIKNYFLGLYCKDYTRNTITNVEVENNIKFDIILTLRPDIRLNTNISHFYEEINNTSKTIFVASQPRFDIYNQGCYPDALCISKRDEMFHLLEFINVLKLCTLNNTNIFHPETSSYKLIMNKNLLIKHLDFFAFLYQNN